MISSAPVASTWPLSPPFNNSSSHQRSPCYDVSSIYDGEYTMACHELKSLTLAQLVVADMSLLPPDVDPCRSGISQNCNGIILHHVYTTSTTEIMPR